MNSDLCTEIFILDLFTVKKNHWDTLLNICSIEQQFKRWLTFTYDQTSQVFKSIVYGELLTIWRKYYLQMSNEISEMQKNIFIE